MRPSAEGPESRGPRQPLIWKVSMIHSEVAFQTVLFSP